VEDVHRLTADPVLELYSDKEDLSVSKHMHKISFGNVDVSKLESEDDFRREAQRLLPNALVQVGEATGEVAWNELQKSFRGVPGFKANTSSSDKRKFIREAGQNYRRQVTAKDRRQLEDYIVARLRELKQSKGYTQRAEKVAEFRAAAPKC